MKKQLILLIMILSCCYITVIAQDNRRWASYCGGPGNETGYTNGIATDNKGNIYLGGWTTSTSGIASGGFQNSYGGGPQDAYLVKLDSAGNRLWATYYGGSAGDFAYDIATDLNGNVYLAGLTSSITGISFNGFQNSYSGGGTWYGDAFLVKFNPSGQRLWATYYGTNSDDSGIEVATDRLGNVYLTGWTNDTSGYMASGGFQNNYGGGSNDAFLVKFDSSGNRVWATYYGGSENDAGYSVTTDLDGNVFLTGYTYSTSGISSPGSFKETLSGPIDAFIVKFDSTGNRKWSTYYGGSSSHDEGRRICTDAQGNLYLAGSTGSSNNIASNGFQNSFGGGTSDAFLAKFNPLGNRIWATYYGGSASDGGGDIIADSAGNIYLGGGTGSSTGISANGFQNNLVGAWNVYLVKFDSAGGRLCSTYYGVGNEGGGFLATDRWNNVFVNGFTQSSSGIASGGFQNTYGGVSDAFLVKFSSCNSSPLTIHEGSIPLWHVDLSPNPSNGKFVVHSNIEVLRGEVYNSLGERVYCGNISSENIIDLSNHPAGIYFLRINSVKGEQVKKLILNH